MSNKGAHRQPLQGSEFRSDETSSAMTHMSRDINKLVALDHLKGGPVPHDSSSFSQPELGTGALNVRRVTGGPSSAPRPSTLNADSERQKAEKSSPKRRKRPSARELEDQGMLGSRRETNRLAVQRHRQRAAEQAEKWSVEVQELRKQVQGLEKLVETYSQQKMDDQLRRDREELKDLRELHDRMQAAVGNWKTEQAREGEGAVLGNMHTVLREQFPALAEVLAQPRKAVAGVPEETSADE